MKNGTDLNLTEAIYKFIFLHPLDTYTSGRSRGRGPGARGPGPPLFLDQTETRSAKKIISGDGLPLYQDLDDCPPPVSEGLDPPLYKY